MSTSWRLLLLVSALIPGGCAEDALTADGITSVRGAFYDCVRPDHPQDGRADHDRVIVLNRDPGQATLTIGFSSGMHQTLEPVQGTSGRLFANQFFAWRAIANGSVLTDVENITTDVCQPVTYAQAAELSRRETRGQ